MVVIIIYTTVDKNGKARIYVDDCRKTDKGNGFEWKYLSSCELRWLDRGQARPWRLQIHRVGKSVNGLMDQLMEAVRRAVTRASC